MTLGEILKRARNSKSYNQQEVIDKLRIKYRMNTHRPTLSEWENNKAIPEMYSLKCLCEIYEISFDDVFRIARGSSKNDVEFADSIDIELKEFSTNKKERKLIEKYRALDDSGKDAIEALLNIEYKRCMKEVPTYISKHILPFFSYPAAAGTGNWNEASYPEFIEVEGDVPDGTKCIIPISGNSMEPEYFDGDRVYMQPVEDCISEGEIGIFLVNGDSFIKQLGNGVLISLNKEYPDIPLADTEWKCQGRILGKVKNK